MTQRMMKRGLVATTFVAALALASLGATSEAQARHCGGGSYGGGHHAHHGHHGHHGRHGGWGRSAYYPPSAIVVGRPVTYGYGGYGRGYNRNYYGGYGTAYRGNGVSFSIGF